MSEDRSKCKGKGIVGLTDDPAKARRQHQNPTIWFQEGPFLSESAARVWVKWYLDQGYTAANKESGWRHGYRFPTASENGK